jgi:hypothetical protein
LLPCFFVHSKPIRGYFAIKIPIPYGGAFQLSPKRFRTSVPDKVLYGPIDEAAALAGSGYPVNRLNSRLGQQDVYAFGHAMSYRDYIHIEYTLNV